MSTRTHTWSARIGAVLLALSVGVLVAGAPANGAPLEREQTVTEQVIEEASRLASAEARPIDDVRSTAEYRREMVRVLTRRGLRQAMERARA